MDRGEPRPPRPPRPPSLIPEAVVDHASQRLFAVSLFVALQCWKLYDILSVKANAFALHKNGAAANFSALNDFTFLVKYAVLDGAFLWLLPVLRIPFLSFLPAVTLLLTVLLNIANAVLTSSSALPLLSTVVVPAWNSVFKQRELTLVGNSMAPRAAVDVSSHFKGRYTIQYLPELSVTLNPFAFSGVCLDLHASLRLPIEFNTTSDVLSMQIERTAPDNTRSLLNYTRNDIRKLAKRDYSHLSRFPSFLTDERVFYLDVDINLPGTYRIHRVLDVDGLTIRPVRTHFSVAQCPSAKFVYSGSDYTRHRCFRPDLAELASSVPAVSVFGVAPLTLQMAAYKDGSRTRVFNTTITNPDAPALEAHEPTQAILESRLLDEPKQFRLSAGSVEFHIISVTDALHNERIYNAASKDKDVSFSVELKLAPELALVDKSPSQMLIRNLPKTLHLVSRQEVAFPLAVEISYSSPLESETLTFHIRSREEFNRGLTVSKPGSYALLSGKDNFCPCSVVAGSVTVTRPEPPSVTISHTPLLDKCVGMVGFEFALNLKGKAPFEVSYEIFKNTTGVLRPVLSERGLRQHKAVSTSTNHHFQYKPRQEGNYVVVFKSVQDAYYRQPPVAIDEAANTFSTYFKKRSSYSLFKDSGKAVKTIRLCKGALTKIPVSFEGSFPFSFTYNIKDVQSGKIVSTKSVASQYQDIFEIETPPFSQGGEFALSLSDVQDHLGCPAECSTAASVQIQARKIVPSVSFGHAESCMIVEGDSVKIPIQLQSDRALSSRDRVEYEFEDARKPGTIKTHSVAGLREITARAAGKYRLSSFVSDGCPGTVQSANDFTVMYHPRPNMTLSSTNGLLPVSDKLFEIKALCQSEKRAAKLRLHGTKPFFITYSVSFPNGGAKTSLITIDNDEISIPLPSQEEGRYTLAFPEFYDGLYTREKAARIAYNFDHPTLRYEVKESPSLVVKKQYIQLCETILHEKSEVQIPLELKGRFPLKVSGTVTNVRSKATEKFTLEIEDGRPVKLSDLKFKSSLRELFSVGEHAVLFEQISDSSDCGSQNLAANNKVMLSITKVPAITLKEKNNYCVGDQITYNLSGISPFVVFYNFNGQDRQAEAGHKFSRLASKPGNLSIIALQDSSAGHCRVLFTESQPEYKQLQLQVHDLPSVEVSHGDSIIKNLHEGDQTEVTFKFTGTPPFLVTYVRTIGESDRKSRLRRGTKEPRRIVDTQTVENISAYEYSAVVSLEGTYEAIMVADAFCRVNRDLSEVIKA